MKRISEIQINSLGNIYQKTNQLKLLQDKLKPFIPEELKPHCHVANFEKGVLIFAVQSSVWAMRFRYAVPELITQLRKKAILPQLASIEHYIEPEFLTLFSRKA